MRHASSQALNRFVQAARDAHQAGAGGVEQDVEERKSSDSPGLQGLALVLHRVLLPHLKEGSADISLAVRQVGISQNGTFTPADRQHNQKRAAASAQ